MVPVNDVFSQEMLLCYIFQYLEPGDILRCRGVCYYFNQVIKTSRIVKRAYYFVPVAPLQDFSGLTSELETMNNFGR